MVIIPSISQELKVLKKAEERVVFDFEHFFVTVGHLREWMRVFKGMLVGFALGNIMVLKGTNSSVVYLPLFMFSLVFSVLAIQKQRRHYLRRGFEKSFYRSMRIFVACLLVSLFALFYTNFGGVMVLTAVMWFFASMSYALE